MAKRVVVEFAGDTSKLDKAFAQVKSGSSGLEKAFKGVAAGAAFGLVTASIGDAIQAASDLTESMSKSANVFGASAAAIDAWAQQGAEDFGLSKKAALEAASSFGNMFSQLGVTSDRAATLSQNMVELAADFASFHNADISQVINAQSSAFRGEYDALQRFLPLINAATVEQRAMELTGKDNAKALTAQEKALAVNNMMYEGAGAAMGDFDRTSDSLANQQRTLAANIENTQAIIGQKLQPVMNDVLQWLNSDGIPGFIKFTEVIGEGMADAAAFFIGALADIASATAQVLEKIDQFVPGLEGIPEQMQSGVAEMRRMEAGLHGVSIELDFATGAAADHAAAQQVAAKALDKMTASAVTGKSAVAELKDAQLDARSASLSLDQATRNLATAQDAYNDFLRTGGIDVEKVTAAERDLIAVQKDVRAATLDVAKAQEAVNEALKPATQKEWLDSSDDQASAQNDLTLAQLDAQDAQREYSSLVQSGTASQNELTRAWIRADEAGRAVRDAEGRLNETQAAANDLTKKGTTDSTAYKDAVAVLAEKQGVLKEATEKQTAAQTAHHQAMAVGKDHADKLWEVTNNLAQAQLDLDEKTWGAEKAQVALRTATDATKTSVRDLWGNVVGLKDDLASGWSVDPALNALVAGPVLPGQNRATVNPALTAGVAGPLLPGQVRARARGGPVSAGHPYLVGEMGPELFTPGRSGSITANGAVAAGPTFIIQGAIDPASTARQIRDILNQDTARGAVGVR